MSAHALKSRSRRWGPPAACLRRAEAPGALPAGGTPARRRLRPARPPSRIPVPAQGGAPLRGPRSALRTGRAAAPGSWRPWAQLEKPQSAPLHPATPRWYGALFTRLTRLESGGTETLAPPLARVHRPGQDRGGGARNPEAGSRFRPAGSERCTERVRIRGRSRVATATLRDRKLLPASVRGEMQARARRPDAGGSGGDARGAVIRGLLCHFARCRLFPWENS